MDQTLPRQSNIPKSGTKAKKRGKKRKRGKLSRGIVRTFFSLFVVGTIMVLAVGGYMFYSVYSFMNGDQVLDLEKEQIEQSQTSFIYAYGKDGKPVEIARLYGTENRIWVDMDGIPEDLKKATIALEDKRFEDHHGVDWIRVVSAVTKNGFSQGGSTITQQLIKNLTNEKEPTFVRKYTEIVSALNLERTFGKDRILEAYLNTIYLGNGCYGVQTAAETYFGKDVKDLNLAECAALIGITQAPSKHDPLRHPEANKKRQKYCLDSMLEQGKITKAVHDEMLNYELVFTNSEKYKPDPTRAKRQKDEGKINSFYVDYVIDSVVRDLMERQGMTRQEATDKIYYGGLEIYAAVDLEIQAQLEDVYVNRRSQLKATTDTKENPAPQSAMTIMDYEGRIVGIVGKAGPKPSNRCLNRATSNRQPGSTIKPLSTYAPAFEMNYLSWISTVLDKGFMVNGRVYPHNVDGSTGSGRNVGMVEAIRQSYNTVPARVINDMLGLRGSFDFLKNNFHLSSLDDKRDVALAPLATGSLTYGTNTVDMCAAYVTFGNGGKYYKPHCYYQVLEGSNYKNVLLDNTNMQPEQAISPATADIIQKLLMNVETKYYGDAKNVRKFDIMAKTGTTNYSKDRWFCVGTPYYMSVVWYGYDLPKDIKVPLNPAAIIAFDVLDRVHKGLPAREFAPSGKAIERKYCLNSRKLATENCRSTAMGWFDTDKMPGSCTRCTPATGIVDDVSNAAGGILDGLGNLLDGLRH